MNVQVVDSVAEMRELANTWQRRGRVVGFVPTMGALHDGHLQLVLALPAAVDCRVASVFVNPTQFGPNEDFERYPRQLGADVDRLGRVGVDCVFAPAAAAMYPPGDAARVQAGSLAAHFCGPLRPGHFEGVATVVTKLFSLLRPQFAAFGCKDFQQLAIIERITTDLMLTPSIVRVATVRDPDGLALSSRNRYLSADERTRASAIPRALRSAESAFAAGERSTEVLIHTAMAELDGKVSVLEYLQIAPKLTLAPYAPAASVDAPAVLAIACRIGATRLIDNIDLG